MDLVTKLSLLNLPAVKASPPQYCYNMDKISILEDLSCNGGFPKQKKKDSLCIRLLQGKPVTEICLLFLGDTRFAEPGSSGWQLHHAQ